MPRLIDGDRLKKIMMAKGIEKGRLKLSAVINEIEIAPAIEAEPVRHGKWLWYSTTMMKCSECGRTVPIHRYKGCPHCLARMSPLLGVKMDGGDNHGKTD